MYDSTKPIFNIGVIHAGKARVEISDTHRMNKALSANDEKNWAPTIAKKRVSCGLAQVVGSTLYHRRQGPRFRLPVPGRMTYFRD